jgi:hypothetical protein
MNIGYGARSRFFGFMEFVSLTTADLQNTSDKTIQLEVGRLYFGNTPRAFSLLLRAHAWIAQRPSSNSSVTASTRPELHSHTFILTSTILGKETRTPWYDPLSHNYQLSVKQYRLPYLSCTTANQTARKLSTKKTFSQHFET